MLAEKSYLKPFAINFEKFKNLVETELTHAVDEEIESFRMKPYNPSDYDVEEILRSLLFLTRKSLILFLEKNSCDFFIIENISGKNELYSPVEDGEIDADNLAKIVGEEILYDFASETLEIVKELYEEMIGKKDI